MVLKPNSRLRHRVAHRAAHRWEPCEICGVVEILRSENVSDDEVVGKAGDGLARVSRVARVRIAALALFLSRASFLTGHCVGREDGFVSVLCARRCTRRCLSRLPRGVFEGKAETCFVAPKKNSPQRDARAA